MIERGFDILCFPEPDTGATAAKWCFGPAFYQLMRCAAKGSSWYAQPLATAAANNGGEPGLTDAAQRVKVHSSL